MKIKHLQQPTDSYLCGQYCVAMATKKSVNGLIKIMGSSKTRTKDLCNGLDIKIRRLVRFGNVFDFKHRVKFAILKVIWKKGTAHWVLYSEGKIYDPLNNMPVPFWTYRRWLRDHGKFTSYLTLED